MLKKEIYCIRLRHKEASSIHHVWEAGAFQSANYYTSKTSNFLTALNELTLKKTEEIPAIKQNKRSRRLMIRFHSDEDKEIQLTIQAIGRGLISPMIGMDDVTPYDL